MSFLRITPRHVMIFAVLLSTFLIGLYFFTIQSEAYKAAERFAKTNVEVRELTGSVSEVGLKFWSGFHVTYAGSGGEASFVLELNNEEGTAVLDVRMTRMADSWNVTEAYITTKTQKGVPIKPTHPPVSPMNG